MNANKKGFTLAELMVAVALIAGSMGAVGLSMITLRSAIVSGSNHLEAQCLAADQAWSVFDIPSFATLVATYSSTPVTFAVPTNSCLYAGGGTIRTTAIESPDTSHCDITVRIDWVQYGYGLSQAASETYTVTRYNTGR